MGGIVQKIPHSPRHIRFFVRIRCAVNGAGNCSWETSKGCICPNRRKKIQIPETSTGASLTPVGFMDR